MGEDFIQQLVNSYSQFGNQYGGQFDYDFFGVGSNITGDEHIDAIGETAFNVNSFVKTSLGDQRTELGAFNPNDSYNAALFPGLSSQEISELNSHEIKQYNNTYRDEARIAGQEAIDQNKAQIKQQGVLEEQAQELAPIIGSGAGLLKLNQMASAERGQQQRLNFENPDLYRTNPTNGRDNYLAKNGGAITSRMNLSGKHNPTKLENGGPGDPPTTQDTIPTAQGVLPTATITGSRGQESFLDSLVNGKINSLTRHEEKHLRNFFNNPEESTTSEETGYGKIETKRKIHNIDGKKFVTNGSGVFAGAGKTSDIRDFNHLSILTENSEGNLKEFIVDYHDEVDGYNVTADAKKYGVPTLKDIINKNPKYTYTPNPSNIRAMVVRPNKDYKPTPNPDISLVDYLKQEGKPIAFKDREKLASSYGITEYKGTPEQNDKLRDLVASGTKPSAAKEPTSKDLRTVVEKVKGVPSLKAFVENTDDNKIEGLNLEAKKYESGETVYDAESIPNVKIVYKKRKKDGQLVPVAYENKNGDRIPYSAKISKEFQYKGFKKEFGGFVTTIEKYKNK